MTQKKITLYLIGHIWKSCTNVLQQQLMEWAAWQVMDTAGTITEATAEDVGRVFELKSRPDLPFTYKDYHPPPQSTAHMQALHPYIVEKSVTRIKIHRNKMDDKSYSSVGMIRDTDCTGTFIGPRHILTAAQCIYDATNKVWFKKYDFMLRKDCDPDTGVLYRWKKAIIPKGYLTSASTEEASWAYDYGMIIVETDTPAHTTMDFGWKDIKIEGEHHPDMFVVGYPEVQGGCMWRDFCKRHDSLYSPPGIIFEHDCDVMDGDGGAPLFFPFTENPVITCIHSYVTLVEEGPDFGPSEVLGSHCVRIRKVVFASLIVWMDKY